MNQDDFIKSHIFVCKSPRLWEKENKPEPKEEAEE